MLYMVTFTINIPPMLAYIPYMDPMGISFSPFCETHNAHFWHLLARRARPQRKRQRLEAFLGIVEGNDPRNNSTIA